MDTNDKNHCEEFRQAIRQTYHLGDPVLLVRIKKASEVSLHRQQHTKQLWYVQTQADVQGGNSGPIEDDFRSTKISNKQVVYGPLPPETVSVEATSDKNINLPMHIAADAFLTQAHYAQTVKLIFKDQEGREVQRLYVPPYPWPAIPRSNWRIRLRDFAQTIGLLPRQSYCTYPKRKSTK